MQAELLYDAGDQLGECPLWESSERALYWLDLAAPKLKRLDPKTGKTSILPLAGPPPAGALLRGAAAGQIVVGGSNGIECIDLSSGTATVLAHPARHLPHLAYNDAKVDRDGRLFVGTLDRAETAPRAVLFMLDGMNQQVADAGFIVCNGPAFSPYNSVLYFSDSMASQILAYDIAPQRILANRRVFATFAPDEGLPDGLTTDAEGGLWVAHWAGGRVTRFDPDGRRDAVVHVPAPNVTACAFGGDDLTTLFITTAREGLTQDQLVSSPLSGALFSIETPVAGLVEPIWNRLT